MDAFRPFSAMHAGVLVTFAIFASALSLLGRRWRDTPRQRSFDRAIAAVVLVLWILITGWRLLPQNFAIERTLPLHVCNIVGLILPLTLLTRFRALRALLYYWGLGLSSQGFFTPDLRDGPAHIGFWSFWAMHFFVCGVAIYDLVARDYRPGWKDFLISALAGIAYVAVMAPLDVLIGANYGFVGPSKPSQPSLVDVLGPWPRRAFIITALGVTLMALMTVPWELARSFKARRSGTAAITAS